VSAESKNDQLKDLQVAIVGMGLMGGSLAMALKPHVKSIIAIDANPQILELAMEKGLVIDATGDLASGIQSADLIVLATPVNTIIDLLIQIPIVKADGCMIIDFGSTKRAICETMNQMPDRFDTIGGHPLCGKEVSGLLEAQADLFEHHSFVLCTNDRTSHLLELVAKQIIGLIGAYPVFLTPSEHDAIVSATSHLPYVVSALLFSQVSSRAEALTWDVSASGFRDSTRLAGSNPDMMSDILRSNRDQVIIQINEYQSKLARFKEILELRDDAALNSLLVNVQNNHRLYRRYLSSKDDKGSITDDEDVY
jgi:prephenate dehydrogenase